MSSESTAVMPTQSPKPLNSNQADAAISDHSITGVVSPSELSASPSFKLYNPPRSAAATPGGSTQGVQELPESYFEPTLDELKTAYQSQKRLRESLVDAPFKTQSAREAEEKSKLNRWPKTTIRVRFPDRTQLEKTFASTDKIKSVYAFVRNSLREDTKAVKFILYQAPPRREFKVSDPAVRDQTLAQLSLAPSSILLLTFVQDEYNSPLDRAPLSEEVWKHAQDLPPPPMFSEPKRDKDEPKSRISSSGNLKSGSKGPDGDKVAMPKWMSKIVKR